MTTRQIFESMLCDMGVFEQQAKQIIDFTISETDKQGGYQITWDRPAVEYPEAFYNVMFSTKIKSYAFEWAEKNMPMAWWKPMFDKNLTV